MAEYKTVSPIRFAFVAATWAQRLALPAGNMWEPAIVRNMQAEFTRLGSDANAAAFVEATWAIRLGLS